MSDHGTSFQGDAIGRALDIAFQYGGSDGEDHKAWVIDQMVRVLTGSGYQRWVKNRKAGEDGPDTYEWSEGVTP